MWKNVALAIAALALAATLAQHQIALNKLRSELAALPRQDNSAASNEPTRERTAGERSVDGRLSQRLAELEQSVAQLTRASDYLMERGQLPLATNRLEDIARKFSDPNLSDAERLQVMRLLRRNGGFTEETAALAAKWIPGITNANLREDALDQLFGATNAVLREPLMRLAVNDPDSDVRQRATRNLRGFMTDPEVEAHLWEQMQNDPDDDVRDEARDSLIEGVLSEARFTAMRGVIANPNSSVEQITVAWRAIVEAERQTPEMANSLAQLALNTKDPKQLVSLYEAFEDWDSAFIAPLINGLQNPNPRVRERAAETLGDNAASNPAAKQWLHFIAENDPDPIVSREAFERLDED